MHYGLYTLKYVFNLCQSRFTHETTKQNKQTKIIKTNKNYNNCWLSCGSVAKMAHGDAVGVLKMDRNPHEQEECGIK